MIKAEMTGRIAKSSLGPNALVGVRLEYDSEDPLSVTMVFYEAGLDEVEWTVSRELLLRGCTSAAPYGEGDVKLRRDGKDVILCITSPDGHCDILLPYGGVKLFLEATTDQVPFGCEAVEADLDAFLQEVLGS